MINRAIGGKALYGFFLAFCTRSFGIDIDDRRNKGWPYLAPVYNTACTKFQARASLVVKTPVGCTFFPPGTPRARTPAYPAGTGGG